MAGSGTGGLKMANNTKGAHTQNLDHLDHLGHLSKKLYLRCSIPTAKMLIKMLIAKYNIYIYLLLRYSRCSKNTVPRGNSRRAGKALVDHRGIFAILNKAREAMLMLSGNITRLPREALCRRRYVMSTHILVSLLFATPFLGVQIITCYGGEILGNA